MTSHATGLCNVFPQQRPRDLNDLVKQPCDSSYSTRFVLFSLCSFRSFRLCSINSGHPELAPSSPHSTGSNRSTMSERRPSALERSPTAPSVLSNGHFASIGGDGDTASYEHGVQVIDENKEFKYGHLHLDPDPFKSARPPSRPPRSLVSNTNHVVIVPTCLNT
jgi:hypothetical protein